MEDNMRKVAETLKERDNFLISVHVNPEGDSVGSQLALFYMLKKLGKKAVMVNHDAVPENLKFLKNTDLVARKIPEGFSVDTVVILDCPVKERVGRVSKLLGEEKFIINIDHHISNGFFGDINWVDAEVSSVGEMMFSLAELLGIKAEKELAVYIYTAIITDTGMFNYSNTSRRTHEIAGRLVENGADPKSVYAEIYESKTESQIRLLARVLATLKLEMDGLVAHVSLTRDMYVKEGARQIATEEFINYPRSIRGVKVAIFFKEIVSPRGKISVSFRSSGEVDVNAIAARFSGGGHTQASGCTLDLDLNQARRQVLSEVQRAIKL